MPLIHYDKSNKDYAVGIWKIEETEDFFKKELHLHEDFNEVSKITSLKKRLQTLGGRYLLKTLVLNSGLVYNGLVKDSGGKPFSKDGNYFASISHTEDMCVAIVNFHKKVGIDIESSREKLLSIAPKFLKAEELLKWGLDLNKLCICWCVKEVVYKINGHKYISLKDHIHIKEMVSMRDKDYITAELASFYECNTFTIKCFRFNNYYIAYNI